MTNVGINPYTGLPYTQNDFNGMPSAAIPVSSQMQNTPAGSAVSDVPTNPDEFVKTAPYYVAGIGTAYLTQKAINAACATDKPFEQSRMAGFARWIDKNETLKNYSKSIDGWINNRKISLGNFKEEHFPTSIKEIIKHLDTGTNPVCSIAKDQYHGVRGMADNELIKELRALVDQGKFPEGYDKLKSIIKDESLLGADAVKQIENELKLAGNQSLGEFVKSSFGYSTETLRNWHIPYTKIIIPLGPLNKRTIKPVALVNKVEGLTAENAKTIFSRIAQKGVLIAGEATAGNVGGGAALGLAMGALCLGSSFKTAMEAPKGEKLSTFMEEFFGNYVGFLATMPAASWLLYKAAGARNIGKEKNVADALAKHSNFKLKGNISDASKGKTIEDAIKDIVDDIKTKSLSPDGKEAVKVDEKTAKAARDEIKALKSLANKETPLLQKPIKFIGRILGLGLEEHAATELFKSAPIYKKAGNLLARHAGGSVRFLLLAFVLPSVLSKPFKWFSHLIFGTPTKKEEDEGKKSDNADNNTQVNQTAQNQAIQPNQTVQPNQAMPAATQSTPVSTVPASTPQTVNTNQRTYMPSADPVVLQAQQNSAVMQKIQDSDKIEKYCEEVMKGSH